MERYNLNFTLFSSYFLLFAFFFYSLTATSQNEISCTSIFCGQGKCVSKSNTPLGLDCECNPGWTAINILDVLHPCLLPNCTINSQCSNASLPQPPAPAPPSNWTIPCLLAWCNDGTCMPEGILGHACHCNQGSANLFNNPAYPCFPICFFGADCDGFELFPPPSPPPTTSNSAGHGPSKALSSWRNFGALTMLMLAATSS